MSIYNLNIIQANLCWSLFWLTYWIFGFYLSWISYSLYNKQFNDTIDTNNDNNDNNINYNNINNNDNNNINNNDENKELNDKNIKEPNSLIYNIISNFFSKIIVTEKRKITDLNLVMFNLIQNMFWTWLTTNIVFMIPFRILEHTSIWLKFVLCLLFTEVWFYHMHIMMHHRQLYIKFHKKHHTFQYPYALTAMYSSAYETILCNTLSVGLGPILFGLPSPYIYIWFILVAFNSVFTHSGFKLKLFGYNIIDNSHDIHHQLFNYNYGPMIILDKLYGTYKFQNS